MYSMHQMYCICTEFQNFSCGRYFLAKPVRLLSECPSYIRYTLWDKVPTVELRRRLGIEGVVEVMRRGRLRWFGHVEQKEVDDWVSACRNLEVAGSKGRGRPRMTWRARLDEQ